MILRTALSSWLASRTRARRQRHVPRPRLPSRAERLYVGAMVLYANHLERLVREAVDASWPEVFRADDMSWPVRTDAVKIGPLRLGKVRRQLGPVAVALNQAAEQVPLHKVGGIVADHARDEAWRVIGLKASDVLPLGHVVDEWRIANARLIKGMTDEMLGRIRDTLEAYDGSRVEDTRDELQATFGMTKSRAALIARDQTLKLNANITEDIHVSVGITEYYWSTSKDSSVRKDHQVLEGVLCKYADPPVVDSRTQARGNPGTYFQCRCVPIPRLPETEK